MKPWVGLSVVALALGAAILYATFDVGSDDSLDPYELQPERSAENGPRDGVDPPLEPPELEPNTRSESPSSPAPTDAPTLAEHAPPAARDGRVAGVVLDAESGLPIDGARVVLTRADGVEIETDTNIAGAFVVAELSNGEPCEITVHARNYAPPRETARVEAAGQGGADVVIRLFVARTARGRVVDVNGEGVAAQLDIRRGARRLSAQTDESGAFVIEDVTRRLGITSKPPEVVAQIWIRSPNHLDAFADLRREHVLNDVPIEVRVTSGATIAGRCVGPGDAPLSGVEVACYPLDDSPFSGMRTTRTDSTGWFRIGGLGTGRHHVEAQPAFASYSPAPRVIDCEITSTGALDESLLFTYTPGFFIRGDVVALLDSAPLPDRIVTLHHRDWMEPIPTLSDHRGTFEFGPLPEGEYSVVLRGVSWFDSDDPKEIVVAAGRDDVHFVVDEPIRDGTLRLELREAISGAPLKSGIAVQLRLFALDDERTDRLRYELDTNESGAVLAPRLRRQSYLGFLIVPGFAKHPVAFEIVSEAQTVVLELPLVPGVSVFGRVVDPAGYPIEGASVRDFRHDDLDITLDPDTGVLTDVTGSFTLHHVDPEAAWICAFAEGWAPTRVEIAPSDADVFDLRLELTQGTRVYGVARHENGAPARRFLLEFAGSIALQRVTTDDAGRFEFASVEEGPFEIRDGDGNSLGADIVGTEPLEFELIVPD